jgi:hypothetical protein
VDIQASSPYLAAEFRRDSPDECCPDRSRASFGRSSTDIPADRSAQLKPGCPTVEPIKSWLSSGSFNVHTYRASNPTDRKKSPFANFILAILYEILGHDRLQLSAAYLPARLPRPDGLDTGRLMRLAGQRRDCHFQKPTALPDPRIRLDRARMQSGFDPAPVGKWAALSSVWIGTRLHQGSDRPKPVTDPARGGTSCGSGESGDSVPGTVRRHSSERKKLHAKVGELLG